jgi:O-antigen/teichoic acid export membrane protein
MRAGFAATVPLTALYALLAAVFAPTLLRLVYGSQYVQYATVVRLFAAYYVILSVSDVFVAALAAQGLTRRIFGGHAVGAIVTLAVGWLLLTQWHASGGALGMIVSLLGALVVFARSFARPYPVDESGAATSPNLVPRR